MSWFGNGTFKQDVLDDIENRIDQHNVSWIDAAGMVSEVLAHLTNSVLFKDSALKKIHELAVAEARSEMMAKINR